jgi:glycosyltransferase involved in cell wall biosynthesis
LVLVRRAADSDRFPAADSVDLRFSKARVARNSARSLFSRIPVQFGALIDRNSGARVAELARDADAFVAFEPRAALHHRFLPRELPRLIDLPDSPVLAARAQRAGHRGIQGLENLLKVSMLERELVEASDLTCVAGPRDRDWIAERYPGSACRIVPVGISAPPHRAPIPSDGTVLFTGDLTFAPNRDAVRFLISEIWPRVIAKSPGARLRVVGHKPASDLRRYLAAAPCETAFSVPDIAPHLDAARVVVAPMRIGSGIKVKVLTSMAAGRPLVMTPLANEGIDAENGTAALIGTDAESIARAVVHVIEDDSLAARLGAGGRRLVETKFSPDAVAATFLDAVAYVVDRSRRRAERGTQK